MSLQSHLNKEKENQTNLGSLYSNGLAKILMHSYTMLGLFCHSYTNSTGMRCRSYNHPISEDATSDVSFPMYDVASIDINNQGNYIASATSSGCITVHCFKELYEAAHKLGGTEVVDDQRKHILHMEVEPSIKKVKWNPHNQEELACAFNRLLIYDVNDLNQTSEFTTPNYGANGYMFQDVAFGAREEQWVASAYQLHVGLWDRRVSTKPVLELEKKEDKIRSIQFGEDDKIIYTAGHGGKLYVDDIRVAGRDGKHSLRTTWEPPQITKYVFFRKLRIRAKGGRSHIVQLLFNPSCSYQLAFRLHTGWVGVLDTMTMELTHLHNIDKLFIGDATWLAESSIFATSHSSWVRLLDFNANNNSPYYVANKENMKEVASDESQTHIIEEDSRVVISGLAAHPLNNVLVAGTTRSSLAIISPESWSCA